MVIRTLPIQTFRVSAQYTRIYPKLGKAETFSCKEALTITNTKLYCFKCTSSVSYKMYSHFFSFSTFRFSYVHCAGLQPGAMVKMVLTGNVSRVSHLFPAHRIFRGSNTAQKVGTKELPSSESSIHAQIYFFDRPKVLL